MEDYQALVDCKGNHCSYQHLPGLESALLFVVPFSDLLSDLAPASEGASDAGGTLSAGAAVLSLPMPSVGGPSPCVDCAPGGCSPLKEATTNKGL